MLVLLSSHCKSVIAATAWFIWKNRCDKIFRDSAVPCQVIASRAYVHVLEFSCATADQFGKRLLLNNFSSADGPYLFISNFWNVATKVGGAGFYCSTSNYKLFFWQVLV